MLSRDLLTVAEALEKVDDDGQVSSALLLIGARLLLIDCIERAAALEVMVVPPAMRVTDADLAGGKVTRLPPRSHA